MKKISRRDFLAASAAVGAAGVLTACGGSASSAAASSTSAAAGSTASSTAALSGNVATGDSTSMKNVIAALTEGFAEVEPGVTVSYDPTGSGAGITGATDKTLDIGLSSRALKDDEKADVEGTTIALDGIAIIVNNASKVEDLTVDQLKQMFTGEITNWKDVGGKDQEIIAFQRRADSGSQTLFQKLLIQGGPLMEAPTELAPTAMGELVDSIAEYNNSANAIGFSVYYYIDQMYSKPGLRLLAVDGVTPGEDTVKDGSYKVQRPFVLVTVEGKTLSPAAQSFFDYATSSEAASIIAKAGAVAAN